VYWPFAKAAERQRLTAPDKTPVSGLAD